MRDTYISFVSSPNTELMASRFFVDPRKAWKRQKRTQFRDESRWKLQGSKKKKRHLDFRFLSLEFGGVKHLCLWACAQKSKTKTKTIKVNCLSQGRLDEPLSSVQERGKLSGVWKNMKRVLDHFRETPIPGLPFRASTHFPEGGGANVAMQGGQGLGIVSP